LAFHSGREADHLPPSSAEVKEWVELYLHSPNTPLWRGTRGSTGITLPLLFCYCDVTCIATLSLKSMRGR
jgi:hypothetical protein